LAEANVALIKGGFALGKVRLVEGETGGPDAAGTILRQYPPAGQPVATGATISFDVSK
jgi:beta-lactam-binding protein with PASTA domain